VTDQSPTVIESGEKKPRKPRKQRENFTRYPVSVNFSITASMGASLVRMCPHNGPFNQSSYLRLVLHRALITDDPIYQRAMSNGKDHA
jgi:hypothetical protein